MTTYTGRVSSFCSNVSSTISSYAHPLRNLLGNYARGRKITTEKTQSDSRQTKVWSQIKSSCEHKDHIGDDLKTHLGEYQVSLDPSQQLLLQSLESLNLSFYLTTANMEILAASCQKLRSITLEIPNDAYRLTTFLTNFRNMTQLCIKGSNSSFVEFNAGGLFVPYHLPLSDLTLSKCVITSTLLEKFAHCTEIKTLNLSGSILTGRACYEVFQQFEKLESLNLSRISFRLEQLGEFCSVDNLLRAISCIKTLKYLTIDYSFVSFITLHMLKAALPNLQVTFVNKPLDVLLESIQKVLPTDFLTKICSRKTVRYLAYGSAVALFAITTKTVSKWQMTSQ